VGVTVIPSSLGLRIHQAKALLQRPPLRPPKVPLDKAFDKVVLRENFDSDGQYLLLDGYFGGKHLHYDGNAIVKISIYDEKGRGNIGLEVVKRPDASGGGW